MVDYNDMSVEQLNEIVEEIKGIIINKETNNREFYVDERGGCIGVREIVDYETGNGLSPDLPDVIKVWDLHSEERQAANTVCDTLNEINIKFVIR